MWIKVNTKQLNKIFGPKHFEKIRRNPLKTDLSDLKSLISELSDFIPKSGNWQICPTESLKRGYCLIKCHKPGNPMRPIISGLNTLKSGCEIYLLNLISPILSECKFSIKNSKIQKSKILSIPNALKLSVLTRPAFLRQLT